MDYPAGIPASMIIIYQSAWLKPAARQAGTAFATPLGMRMHDRSNSTLQGQEFNFADTFSLSRRHETQLQSAA
jgi:hypothetical protein